MSACVVGVFGCYRRQPERKKRLPAQPEPMKYALASQRKNTIGWCVKGWQQTANNRNHWQVDDGCRKLFVTFPENGHSKSSYLRSWRYCNFADWFWKKPDFSIVLCGKARFEPKYVHFSGCPATQHRGRSDKCKMGLTDLHDSYGSWHLYICHPDLPFSFRSLDLLRRFTLVYEGHFVLGYKEKLEPFKRS